MTNAFELAGYAGDPVPGSRGSFKQASIVTMNAIREARSTILAMLEAFLYDPLLSWTVSLRFAQSIFDEYLMIDRRKSLWIRPHKPQITHPSSRWQQGIPNAGPSTQGKDHHDPNGPAKRCAGQNEDTRGFRFIQHDREQSYRRIPRCG